MYDKFYGYLTELEANFSKLSVLLHSKLTALERFDLGRLDEIIKEEQVFVLLSKSFDSTVASYRQKLNLQGERLSDIVEELPPQEQGRFRSLFEKLSVSLEEVKSLNQKCQELTEERLYSLDKAIKELDRSTGTAYGKQGSDAKRPGSSPHMFTKTV